MALTVLTPRAALNKAYLKVKPARYEIEMFKSNLNLLLENINDNESEEFQKNLVIEFLKDTYYKQNYFINTKERNDLVIHTSNTAKSPVGVIIEAKKYSNKNEMISLQNLNTKAFQELVLYFLRERIKFKNYDIKHLVITNIYEWYIFDVNTFERLITHNKAIIKKFESFEAGKLAGNTTEFFYNEIAKPYINNLIEEIEFTYFDLRNYKKIIEDSDIENDKQLIALYKILSPEHLLKLPFSNDSNYLDKNFYTELLHIIGLTELKKDGKRVIDRNKKEQRYSGTLVEGTIIQLESLDKLNRLNRPALFGDTKEERLFNVALALSITWINRILFLKLLEAQLITYHKGDKNYAFLNLEKVKNFDDLNSLFFQVLACKHESRSADVKQLFSKVPYLNSSLFEPTEVEHQALFISNLKDNQQIPIHPLTVLKDKKGKKRVGELTCLEYIFEFLNAYDFSSEGVEEIQEENKTLINASVLGLIFEKINGYKEGSFFTPGVITMYMCREALRMAVFQKFKEAKGWDCKDMADLYNRITDKNEAVKIVNDIRICDPAVGSGHFLVSALNELIAIKAELGLLLDQNGRSLKDYNIEVENDELIVTDDEGKLFEYRPNNKESQRVQKALFHEKETIIENCLFGVDINPNSVKICRLRLWIELLKNAYYKNEMELETLPNIDINIKSGNSLISRFSLDADLSSTLKNSKWTIDSYKLAVDRYRNAATKEEKREMEELIASIKSDFRSEVHLNDPKIKRLRKVAGELAHLTNQSKLFEMSQKEKIEWNRKVKKLTAETQKIEAEISEIRNNKIYENAFEWRFEFPEVLDKEGNFVGFDVIIGNPPYIQLQTMGKDADALENMDYETYVRTGDIYSIFYEKGQSLLKQHGHLVFITSNKWMRAGYGENTREFLAKKTNPILLIDFAGQRLFDTATVDTNILLFSKSKNEGKTKACTIKEGALNNLSVFIRQNERSIGFTHNNSWTILSDIEMSIKAKIERVGKPLKDWNIQINYGIKTGYNDAFIISGEKKNQIIAEDPKSEEIIRPILRGRDIKKYGYNFSNLWLINTHNGVKERRIDPIEVEDYPAVKKHLDQYYQVLEKRADKGDTPYNLRNCAYMDDFSKQKIVWGEISDRTKFSIDIKGEFITEATTFLLTGPSLFYLLAFLNSKISEYFFSKIGTTTGVGTVRWKKFTIEQLCVPKISKLEEQKYVDIVKQIIEKNAEKEDFSNLLKVIDEMIYTQVGLSVDEINFIESQ